MNYSIVSYWWSTLVFQRHGLSSSNTFDVYASHSRRERYEASLYTSSNDTCIHLSLPVLV